MPAAPVQARMRPLAFVALGLVLAASAPAAGERTREALRAVLPAYSPAAADAAKPGETPPQDPDVVVLPEFRVVERKVATPEADDWLRGETVTRREMRRAEGEMNALDLALNRWHLPYLSASFAQRTRAAYEQRRRGEELRRLEHLQRLSGP